LRFLGAKTRNFRSGLLSHHAASRPEPGRAHPCAHPWKRADARSAGAGHARSERDDAYACHRPGWRPTHPLGGEGMELPSGVQTGVPAARLPTVAPCSNSAESSCRCGATSSRLPPSAAGSSTGSHTTGEGGGDGPGPVAGLAPAVPAAYVASPASSTRRVQNRQS
jgi:hypothetical protein